MLVRHPILRTVAVLSGAALALVTVSPAQAKPRPAPPSGTAPVLVADGVVSPLHLAAGPGGHEIYIADPFTGRLLRADVTDRSTGTVTIAEDLTFAPGLTLQGNTVHVVGSEGDDPEGPATLTYLGRLTRDGTISVAHDLLEFELDNNPDGQPLNEDAQSNPYDVLAYKGGFIVVDAAANALLRVSASGRVSVLTVFPLDLQAPCDDPDGAGDNNGDVVGCDPVPTGVALGPDGYLYVSGLGAFVRGHVWKVDPRTGEIVATLTATHPDAPPLTDIAVGDDGAIYAASPFAGAVFRLRNGQLSVAELEGAASLLWSRGTLYVGAAPAVAAEDGPPPPGAVYAVPAGAFQPLTP